MTAQTTHQSEDAGATVPLEEAARATHDEPIEQVVAHLVDRDPAVRLAAERRLQLGDEESLRALVATLECENRKKPWRFGIALAVVLVLVTLVTSAAASYIRREWHFQVPANLLVLLAFGAGTLFAGTRLQKAVARLLAEQNDLRAVGPLCEALDRQDGRTTRLAAGALARLLPQLRASDAGLLAPHQRKMLWDALLRIDDPALAHGILHAALQTGDERAVAIIEKVATGKKRRHKLGAVRAEAAALLPALRERVAEVRATSLLLRPAEAPGPDALLRPASGPRDLPPEELLRPAERAGQ